MCRGPDDRAGTVIYGVASIDAKGKERAEINEKKLEEIMDRLDSMKSKGILDVFKRFSAGSA